MKRSISLFICLVWAAFCWAETWPQLGKSSLEEVMAAMTLEEKIRLVTGTGEVTEDLRMTVGYTDRIVPGAAGTTFPIERLGIPAIVLADGPSGLRIDVQREGDDRYYYCTAFPVPTLLASTWNLPLVQKVGEAMGNEVLEYNCDILLAPALNIHRNPLCGRNYEYYSEDPYLSGKMASAMVLGIQKNGVGTSIKHFAVNNQETNRIANDAILSPRVLREIYLKGFEMVVKEAKPWTVMSSYNKINGTYTSESFDLLTTILREEWGFEGMVVTDWFGGRDAVAQVKAGNDLLMPGKVRQQDSIRQALTDGRLSMNELDRNVRRILELILRTPHFKRYMASNSPDLKEHAAITRETASEGMILLKNERQVLPLSPAIKDVALFGNTSYRFTAGGTGSGDVNEAYTVSLEQGLEEAGYVLDLNLKERYEIYLDTEESKIDRKKYNHVTPPRIPELKIVKDEILKKAKEADVAIITLGRNAGEYADRKLENDFELSSDERAMLEEVSTEFHRQGKPVIVIMNVAGIIEMASWQGQVDAILLAWQGGQEGGHSVADLLSGQVNPSGKLPMTIPVRYHDIASSRNFPLVGDEEAMNIYREFYTGARGINRLNIDYTRYEEGIWVGYRYFDQAEVKVAYPFGYGLSYTTFEYGNPECRRTADGFEFVCTVTNTGRVAGKEVVQLYVTAPGVTMIKPAKELRAFAKTRLLAPGETEVVKMSVSEKELASFDENRSCWVTEPGEYKALWGASSQQICLERVFLLEKEWVGKEVRRVLYPER